MHGQSWARVHVEQACHVTGELLLAEGAIHVDCMGDA